MKKITLLFLALSAVAFAGVSTTKGSSTMNTQTTSAKIDVNVTAQILEDLTALKITDTSDVEITAVNFNHEVAAETTSDSLTANLKVIGVGLMGTNTSLTLDNNTQ
ncbi:MAG: hypothetical protein ACRCZI_00620, partial [Cetobacterium sp.]